MRPLEKATLRDDAAKDERVIEDAMKKWPELTRDEVIQQMADVRKNEEVYLNDKYQVYVRLIPNGLGEYTVAWLSIKRIDKNPIHDWRELQEIKSQLCGAECEGVELYPAESRVVDVANQYHIYVVMDEKFRWPFGFRERKVDYEGSRDAGQRPKGS